MCLTANNRDLEAIEGRTMRIVYFARYKSDVDSHLCAQHFSG